MLGAGLLCRAHGRRCRGVVGRRRHSTDKWCFDRPCKGKRLQDDDACGCSTIGAMLGLLATRGHSRRSLPSGTGTPGTHAYPFPVAPGLQEYRYPGNFEPRAFGYMLVSGLRDPGISMSPRRHPAPKLPNRRRQRKITHASAVSIETTVFSTHVQPLRVPNGFRP